MVALGKEWGGRGEISREGEWAQAPCHCQSSLPGLAQLWLQFENHWQLYVWNSLQTVWRYCYAWAWRLKSKPLTFKRNIPYASECYKFQIPIMVSYGRTYERTDIHTYRRTWAVYRVASQLKIPNFLSGHRKEPRPFFTNMNRTHTQTKHTLYLNSCTYCTTVHKCTSVNTSRHICLN